MPPLTLLKFPPPPNDIAPFDALPNGIFSNPWQRWFLALARAFAIAVAPADAAFVVTAANPALTHATNLGALVSGYLRIVTLAGVATVFSDVVVTSQVEPTIDVTIRTNESGIVADRFVIALGRTLTINPGAVFQVT